ncbi:hypothetical protein AVEN_20933-1 [Araneus ventricosus]|uniref:Uncharacterized protein n=1 Tax=Araneus ventricosus TaxID=182803 RepID=A0A4Y2KNP6_ARAVE|nr:hypothetical protein AVEN_20933-1 [Araneus ventricosus]
MTLGLGAPPLPPQNENAERVREIVRANRRITIDAIASELGISHMSVHSILHDGFNMYRICLHMVPKMLSPEQKEQCQMQCYHSGTPSLFSRPSSSGFIPVSTAENEIEGTLFCGFR